MDESQTERKMLQLITSQSPAPYSSPSVPETFLCAPPQPISRQGSYRPFRCDLSAFAQTRVGCLKCFLMLLTGNQTTEPAITSGTGEQRCSAISWPHAQACPSNTTAPLKVTVRPWHVFNPIVLAATTLTDSSPACRLTPVCPPPPLKPCKRTKLECHTHSACTTLANSPAEN